MLLALVAFDLCIWGMSSPLFTAAQNLTDLSCDIPKAKGAEIVTQIIEPLDIAEILLLFTRRSDRLIWGSLRHPHRINAWTRQHCHSNK